MSVMSTLCRFFLIGRNKDTLGFALKGCIMTIAEYAFLFNNLSYSKLRPQGTSTWIELLTLLLTTMQSRRGITFCATSFLLRLFLLILVDPPLTHTHSLLPLPIHLRRFLLTDIRLEIKPSLRIDVF
jgi:hypothetical protein